MGTVETYNPLHIYQLGIVSSVGEMYQRPTVMTVARNLVACRISQVVVSSVVIPLQFYQQI